MLANIWMNLHDDIPALAITSLDLFLHVLSSTVRHLLHQKIRDSYMHPRFMSDVMKPLQIEQLMDQEVVNLSGGELQRVALCLCFGKFGDAPDAEAVKMEKISIQKEREWRDRIDEEGFERPASRIRNKSPNASNSMHLEGV
ncbi:hypothetical protein Syun_017307 [Stephania yunnanensis]|uniref:ABC transporter domain-containing protein n=1 Tax=Stephania yunnanensis TaxID=152371 RepID=A0AAP0J7L6_9MAGN